MGEKLTREEVAALVRARQAVWVARQELSYWQDIAEALEDRLDPETSELALTLEAAE